MSDERILQCVPNFSEGRDPRVIAAILAAYRSVPEARVIHVDSGASANRTVVTIVGPPDALCEAAWRGIREATLLIDMRRQTGTHPRIGATDVCPLIPIAGLSLDEVATYANSLAQRVVESLKIPVYFYEHNALRESRRDLGRLRRGGFEGLGSRMDRQDGSPDLGPKEPHQTAGAMVMGARHLLVAYNVNLDTRSVAIAQDIAEALRESGGRNGPGRLKGLKALGWWVDEFDCAQVSCNLVDYRETGLWDVFQACREEARKRNVRVTGSELVGLVPEEALMQVGRAAFALEGGDSSPVVSAEETLARAVRTLGLRDVRPFDADRRILERVLRSPQDPPVVGAGVSHFLGHLASSSPTPGGGGAAAIAGAMGAALVAMVARLAPVSESPEGAAELGMLIRKADELRTRLQLDANRDASVFNSYMAVLKRPKGTLQEKAERKEALMAAAIDAARCPAEIVEGAHQVLELAEEALARGTAHTRSDGVAAALLAQAAASVAACQVAVNVGHRKDQKSKDLMSRSRGLQESVEKRAQALLNEYLT